MKRERILVVLLVLFSVLGIGKSLSQPPRPDQKKGELPQTQTADQKKAYPALPSETPPNFAPATDSFDYVRRDVMIPIHGPGGRRLGVR